MGNNNDEVPNRGLLDRLTRVDSILKNRIVPLLEEIAELAEDFNIEIDTNKVVVEDREKHAHNVEFSAIVPPTDSDDHHEEPVYTVTREMPIDGFVEELFVYFRRGTNDKVGFKLERESSGDNLFPSNPEAGYYSADGIGHPFNVGFTVDEGEEITAKFVNNNVDTERLVTVVMTVVEDGG